MDKDAFMKFKEAAEALPSEDLELAYELLAMLANKNQGVIFNRPSGTRARFNVGANMMVSIDFIEGQQSVTIEGNKKTPAAIPMGSNILKVVAI